MFDDDGLNEDRIFFLSFFAFSLSVSPPPEEAPPSGEISVSRFLNGDDLEGEEVADDVPDRCGNSFVSMSLSAS